MKLKELNNKTSQELDELVAVAQGLYKAFRNGDSFYQDSEGYLALMGDYQPTADTEQGRSQCWELMVNNRLAIDYWHGNIYDVKFDISTKGSLQRAVVIAAILSLQGEG